ncbi:MAG: molybdenum cofactor guanylyltransferase, partial [Chloroflexota bacterium]
MRKIIAFFPEVRVRYVDEAEINRFDPAHLSFINVNTPAELAQARALAG